ncbi:hypothetical protein EC991_002089 [Linnemannia zychae]|nr:hypothetical protein EC991_002089 [Linnemannia zychae]
MSVNERPTVIIVGAGLGGLMLGALLEKSGVPYIMLERAVAVKPLGSAMAVGPSLLPAFEQLGIYDEFIAISKALDEITYFQENVKGCKPADHRPVEELGGYGYRVVSRPILYSLFLKQVPAEKIHFGHRVLNISEDDDKITVHLSNSETFVGDIVVGADGAYSAVRQRMYSQLKDKGELPLSDYEELPFSYTCLVGQTTVLDPKEFPFIKDSASHFNLVLGAEKPFSSAAVTTTQNTVCWTLVHYLDGKTSKAAMEQRFRSSENSEWGDYPAQSMCEETRNFPVELNDGKKRTIGELYDKTPKEYISKVMLEEKVFDTWYSGRAVLLGDACHKLHPMGGQGAVTAMHDAIALANLLYTLQSSSLASIAKVFEEYRAERHPVVTDAYKAARMSSKMIEKGFIGALTLFVATSMPKWLWKKVLAAAFKARPQVGYLPEIKSKGSVVPLVSPSFLKAKAAYEKTPQAVVPV